VALMADAFPMVAACATGQGNAHMVNVCACGEEKRLGYWQCPTCDLKAAIEHHARLGL
jgi:hypothetical protein